MEEVGSCRGPVRHVFAAAGSGRRRPAEGCRRSGREMRHGSLPDAGTRPGSGRLGSPARQDGRYLLDHTGMKQHGDRLAAPADTASPAISGCRCRGQVIGGGWAGSVGRGERGRMAWPKAPIDSGRRGFRRIARRARRGRTRPSRPARPRRGPSRRRRRPGGEDQARQDDRRDQESWAESDGLHRRSAFSAACRVGYAPAGIEAEARAIPS